jgi:hypothetical protein
VFIASDTRSPSFDPLHSIGIFLSAVCTSFVHIIIAVIEPRNKKIEYITFAEVELRHEGHAAHKHEAADDVMQHAKLPIPARHILEKKNIFVVKNLLKNCIISQIKKLFFNVSVYYIFKS